MRAWALALALAASPSGQLRLHKEGQAIEIVQPQPVAAVSTQVERARAPVPAPALVSKAALASGAALATSALEVGSKDGPATSVSSDDYFDRLMESLAECVLGFVAILFSIAALWINERRSADQWALLSEGESKVVPLEAETPDGTLVHVKGTASTTEQISDDAMGVKVSGAARLRRRAQIYQWVERSQTDTQEHMGGRRERTTRRWYEKDWSDFYVDPQHFAEQKDNGAPVSVDELHKTLEANQVKLDRTTLSESQVQRLTKWEPVEGLQAKSALGRDFKPETVAVADGRTAACLYGGKGTPGSPEVGDIKMFVEQVKCGDTTVVALLCADSYLPYRPVDRGFFTMLTSLFKSVNVEDEQQALLAAGRDSSGPKTWSCTSLCCICNIVEQCFHGLTPVQIDHVAEEQQEVQASFASMAATESSKTWMIRFGGWLGLYAGLVAVFSPLVALLNFMPFLAGFGAFIVYVFAFIVTVSAAIMIISVAYLAYRPGLAICGFLVVFALAGMTQAPPVKTF